MPTDICELASQSNPKISVSRQDLPLRRNEFMFIAAWERALMIHFEVDAEELQRDVPYELDLRDGRAFISLVAFTMRGMRPGLGSKLMEWLFRPIATHDFLNVRTYVRHRGEVGIHFLAEWLSNWLAVRLGPRTFGLPYRHGRISYSHHWQGSAVRGCVEDIRTGAAFSYRGKLPCEFDFEPCESGSLDEWLMERYIAFNSVGSRRRFFRVWHPPWLQCPAEVKLQNISLLTHNWHWFHDARLIGANFSPGFQEVRMGRPHRIKSR
jgi:uncharacterized protein YqjF (DUF2071 family)